MDTPRVPTQEWNPQALLADLMLDSQFDNHDAAATVSRILREHGAVAAQSIAHLAVYAGNERVRLQAAQYIVDRTLTEGLDADIQLLQAQQALVGQALFATLRVLGLEYNFSIEDPRVRHLVNKTLISISERGSNDS